MGVVFHRWKLGFSQCRLNLYLLQDFLHTRLAARRVTYLHTYPRSQHASFPLAFQLKVGWVS